MQDTGVDFGNWTGYSPPLDRSDWHPLVRRFYEQWVEISPPGRLPGRQHIVPEDLSPIWSRLWMFDVTYNPLRYRYRLCGTELVRSMGQEVTGRWVDEVHPQLIVNPDSRERYRFMVESGLPTWRRGPPLWTHNPDYRTLESCIVPLASDGQTVDKLMGVLVLFDSQGRPI